MVSSRNPMFAGEQTTIDMHVFATTSVSRLSLSYPILSKPPLPLPRQWLNVSSKPQFMYSCGWNVPCHYVETGNNINFQSLLRCMRCSNFLMLDDLYSYKLTSVSVVILFSLLVSNLKWKVMLLSVSALYLWLTFPSHSSCWLISWMEWCVCVWGGGVHDMFCVRV